MKFYRVIIPYFFAILLTCLLLLASASLFVGHKIIKQQDQTEAAIMMQTIQTIQNAIMVSSVGEVRYFCENLVRSNLVRGIRVKNSNEVLCEYGVLEERLIEEKLFFDDERANLAGIIEISPIPKAISITVIMISMMAFICIFIVLIFFIFKMIEKKLNKEIYTLENSLKKTLIGRNENSKWIEFNSLLYAVKELYQKFTSINSDSSEKMKHLNSSRRYVHDLKAITWQLEKELDKISFHSEAVKDLNLIVSKLNNLDLDRDITHVDFESRLFSLKSILKDSFGTEISFQDVSVIERPPFGYFNLFLIIKNLVLNSIEANSIQRIKVKISYKIFPTEIQIVVTDNGLGFSSDHLEILGSERVLSKKKNGSGVGLFEIKQLLRNYGSEISFSNNNGAVIKIVLPRNLNKTIDPLTLIDHRTCFIDDDKYFLLHLKSKFPNSIFLSPEQALQFDFSNISTLVSDKNLGNYAFDQIVNVVQKTFKGNLYLMSFEEEIKEIGLNYVVGFIPKKRFNLDPDV